MEIADGVSKPVIRGLVRAKGYRELVTRIRSCKIWGGLLVMRDISFLFSPGYAYHELGSVQELGDEDGGACMHGPTLFGRVI